MRDYFSDELLLEVHIVQLKQRVESRDFQEAAKVATQISKVCKRLRPDYDYSCSLSDFENILNTLACVDYGVGKPMSEVVW